MPAAVVPVSGAFARGLEKTRRSAAAPAQQPQTFLTARLPNTSGVPLLPGPVSVFLTDELLGRTQLPYTPQGDELELAFGADDRVQVERKLVQRRHETAGIFTRDDVYRFHARLA